MEQNYPIFIFTSDSDIIIQKLANYLRHLINATEAYPPTNGFGTVSETFGDEIKEKRKFSHLLSQ